MAQAQLRKIEQEDDYNTNTSDESICISANKEENREDELYHHENLDDCSECSRFLGRRLNTRLQTHNIIY